MAACGVAQYTLITTSEIISDFKGNSKRVQRNCVQGLRGLHSVSLTFTRVRDELDWPFLLFVIYILQTIHEKTLCCGSIYGELA